MRRSNFSGILKKKWILNLSKTTRSSDTQQKQRTCQIVDFAIAVDHRVKLKEVI